MAAVLAVLKGRCDYYDHLFIGTTAYVMEDRTSDLARLVDLIDPEVPVIGCDPMLSKSSEPGLEAFAHGYVKEGVGAGGACIASMIKESGGASGEILLAEIEQEYRNHIKTKKSA